MEEDVASPVPPNFFQSYGPALILGGLSFFFILAALVLLFKTIQTSEPIQFSSDAGTASQSARLLVVDIAGEVIKPGVYTLPETSRVEDLLIASGGLAETADQEWVSKSLNRASILTDGAKYFIPKKGALQENVRGVQTNDTTSIGQIGVSINSASEKDLDTLPGVGTVTVQKIISNRPYQRLEELLEKKVLTPSVFEKVKAQISL